MSQERYDAELAKIRETPITERLAQCDRIIGRLAAEHRGPKMRIPAEPTDEDLFVGHAVRDASVKIGALERRCAVLEAYLTGAGVPNVPEMSLHLAPYQAEAIGRNIAAEMERRNARLVWLENLVRLDGLERQRPSATRGPDTSVCRSALVLVLVALFSSSAFAQTIAPPCSEKTRPGAPCRMTNEMLKAVEHPSCPGWSATGVASVIVGLGFSVSASMGPSKMPAAIVLDAGEPRAFRRATVVAGNTRGWLAEDDGFGESVVQFSDDGAVWYGVGSGAVYTIEFTPTNPVYGIQHLAFPDLGSHRFWRIHWPTSPMMVRSARDVAFFTE